MAAVLSWLPSCHGCRHGRRRDCRGGGAAWRDAFDADHIATGRLRLLRLETVLIVANKAVVRCCCQDCLLLHATVAVETAKTSADDHGGGPRPPPAPVSANTKTAAAGP